MNVAILLVHLLGLGLALGAAAVKVSLLLACRADPGRTSAYLLLAPIITRCLVAGIGLLTVSGITWLVLGRPITPLLSAKIGLVATLWVLGPIIDKRVEPAFVRLAPAAGDSRELARARRRYLAFELVATGLLGAITVLGVLV
jgi:hypothetical protein